MQEKSVAMLETYKQIGAKEAEMQNLLNSGSQDTNRIGQLMIEIYKLRTQPLPANNEYRQRALAVLTADQRVKLSLLEQALLLNTPAYQAVTLNLIDGPPAQILPAFPRVLQASPPVRFQP
jgi:Spy/CpxP family protein refolding chaperone